METELNAEQAIDILERFDFFQGQRAGRELWNSKPFDVQEQDIADFSRDVGLLKNYIKKLTEENEAWQKQLITTKEKSDKAYYELACEVEDLRAENEVAVDDLKRCMYYAKPKSANTCNFCIHDCEVSKDGTQCKGKDNWIYCSPVWRGVVKSKSEGE